MWLPFLCLAAGAILARLLHPLADRMMQLSLFVLLLGLGARIGADRKLLAAIPVLGIKALILCILASGISLLLIILWERAFLKGVNQTAAENESVCQEAFSHEYLFIIGVVLSLAGGVGAGHFASLPGGLISKVITIALVAIYLSVGVGLKEGVAGLGANINKLAYLTVPIIIVIASVIGGMLGAVFLNLNSNVAGGIGGGVGYYSLTAAMITQKSGVEYGFIAFLTNFIREVLTFFLTPWLARLSNLAPIALGGASTMDTTLAVMKRYLGEDYAILAFISGVILTLIVPFLLMLLLSIQ